MLAAEPHDALRLAEQALAMADPLGLDDVRADALINIGSAETILGRPEGVTHLEASIEILERLGSLQVLRAYNNLVHTLLEYGELARAEVLADRGLAAGRRFGFEEWLHWLREKRTQLLYLAGRWDEALAVMGESTARLEIDGAHYLETSWLQLQTLINLARGERGLAAAESERSLELARAVGDPQMLQPALVLRLKVLVELGELDAATALIGEGVAMVAQRQGLRSQYWIHFADAALALGREEEALAALRGARGIPWVDAARAVLARDLERAVEILAAIDAPASEADVRRRLARERVATGRRADAGAQLEQATAFWDRVGATAYLREAQALLEVAS
jgi:tetratricopeptide (TPR) repeat protein